MIQRDIEYSGQFSKDVKLAQKRHKIFQFIEISYDASYQ